MRSSDDWESRNSPSNGQGPSRSSSSSSSKINTPCAHTTPSSHSRDLMASSIIPLTESALAQFVNAGTDDAHARTGPEDDWVDTVVFDILSDPNIATLVTLQWRITEAAHSRSTTIDEFYHMFFTVVLVNPVRLLFESDSEGLRFRTHTDGGFVLSMNVTPTALRKRLADALENSEMTTNSEMRDGSDSAPSNAVGGGRSFLITNIRRKRATSPSAPPHPPPRPFFDPFFMIATFLSVDISEANKISEADLQLVFRSAVRVLQHHIMYTRDKTTGTTPSSHPNSPHACVFTAMVRRIFTWHVDVRQRPADMTVAEIRDELMIDVREALKTSLANE